MAKARWNRSPRSNVTTISENAFALEQSGHVVAVMVKMKVKRMRKLKAEKCAVDNEVSFTVDESNTTLTAANESDTTITLEESATSNIMITNEPNISGNPSATKTVEESVSVERKTVTAINYTENPVSIENNRR